MLEPLGLGLKAGAWYLVAWRAGEMEPRTYRAANFKQLRVHEDDGFRCPRRFDLAALARGDRALRTRAPAAASGCADPGARCWPWSARPMCWAARAAPGRARAGGGAGAGVCGGTGITRRRRRIPCLLPSAGAGASGGHRLVCLDCLRVLAFSSVLVGRKFWEPLQPAMAAQALFWHWPEPRMAVGVRRRRGRAGVRSGVGLHHHASAGPRRHGGVRRQAGLPHRPALSGCGAGRGGLAGYPGPRVARGLHAAVAGQPAGRLGDWATGRVRPARWAAWNGRCAGSWAFVC